MALTSIYIIVIIYKTFNNPSEIFMFSLSSPSGTKRPVWVSPAGQRNLKMWLVSLIITFN